MINSSLITNLLKAILGQTYPLGSSSGNNQAYICLGYSVSLGSNGDISSFEEPAANLGYKRYLIGAYQSTGNIGTLVNKCSIANGQATNTDTLYFDEALADWTEEGHKLKYFGIANSASGTPVAYGYIVDPLNPNVHTELEVKAHQVPIIRQSQLQLSIKDLTEIPTEDYTLTISYFDATSGQDVQIYTAKATTTAIGVTKNNVLYSQVVLTEVTQVQQSTLSPVPVTFDQGQVIYIQTLAQVADKGTLVPVLDASQLTMTNVKVMVQTAQA